jgi:hypothetical protein
MFFGVFCLFFGCVLYQGFYRAQSTVPVNPLQASTPCPEKNHFHFDIVQKRPT